MKIGISDMQLFFVKRVALWLFLCLRRVVWNFKPILSVLGIELKGKWFSGRRPLDFPNIFTMSLIWWKIRSDPNCLLQVREVRQILAKQRANQLISKGEIKKSVFAERKIADNTLEYNLEGAKTAADLDRPSVMFGVVSGIERVWKNRETMDVLSIGPRSEIEIFGLIGAGFNIDKIRAVDLFSYSPYVEIGDMHALPYPDSSFDVIFLGWVLSYSTDQQSVARELVRVCRNRCIVVIAGDYSDGGKDRPTFNNTTTHMQSTEQVLRLFDGHLGQVYFRHDPAPPEVAMVMTVFEVAKK